MRNLLNKIVSKGQRHKQDPFVSSLYEEFNNVKLNRKVIFVSHDACFNGAQVLAYNIIKQLKLVMHFEVNVILIRSGEIRDRFEKYADSVFCLEESNIEELVKWIEKVNCECALLNTVISGSIIKILHENGLKCFSFIHEMENVVKQYHAEESLKNIVKYSKKIIFASNYVLESIKKISNVRPEQIIIRPQGQFFKSADCLIAHEDADIRSEYNIPRDNKIVLAVAYGDYRKGLDLFADVCEHVISKRKDVTFIWVGALEREIENKVRDFIYKKHLSNNIIFAGQKKDFLKFYKASDIFLLTSREDPFPSVVMEALSFGLPVICFEDGGGYVDLIDESTGKIVPMEDTESMADETLRYLDEDLESIKKNIAYFVKDKFNFMDYVYFICDLIGYSFRKVTAIVPNYNYCEYLNDRIFTIQNQSYPIYEILILDDYSTDNSKQTIFNFACKNPIQIKTCFNSVNSKSVFSQWSKGFSLASGEFVWMAEADDLCKPTMIEKLLYLMENDDSVILAYAQSYMLSHNNEILAKSYKSWTDDIDIYKWGSDYVNDSIDELKNCFVVKNIIPNVSAVLFRAGNYADLLKQASTYKVAGDYFFYSNLLKKSGLIGFVSESLNFHRRHKESVTQELDKRVHYDEVVKIQEMIINWFGKNNVSYDKVLKYRNEVKEYLLGK